MSIDFATLQGLTIPEGVVTQITDASGRVLWNLETSKPVVLQVAKQTITTYAGETSYENESVVLLDIYPKTNGTVTVTYGGLTKTVTDTSGAAEPNAQQVFFGTFNGVSDSTTTPTSGTLTIEGGYSNFACGAYQNGSKTTNKGYCPCITNVVDWGSVTEVANYAFRGCSALALTSLPSSITSIGQSAFYDCSNLALTSLPSSITSIGQYAFYNCSNLALTSLPSSITSIGEYTFHNCSNLALTSLPSGVTSIGNSAFYNCNKILLSSLPSGVTSIGISAFYFENIPDYTGTGIAMLCGEITIPASIASIGQTAFAFDIKNASSYYRMYLATVKVLATTPPTMTGYVFGSIHYNAALEKQGKEFKVVVPVGCGDTYKAAEGWSGYADYIVEVS